MPKIDTNPLKWHLNDTDGQMRRFLYVMILLWCGPVSQAAESGNVVTIKVTGITESKGSLRATLDAGAEAFKNNAPPMLTREVTVDGKEMVLVFRNVPAGTYAVKIYHDENNDQKLNTNLFGVPEEKYGISNNVRGRFGLPGYEDASFKVNSGEETAMTISLKKHGLF